MAVTQTQLAKQLKVSQETVSSALRGDPRCNERTRKRVLRAAEKAGYRMNPAARAMKTGRHHALGLLLSQHGNISAIPWILQWNIQECMGEHDLHMVMAHVRDEKLESRIGLPRLLREWSVDGLMLSYRINPPPMLEQVIEQMGIPSVWINSKRAYDCTHPDDVQGGHIATQAMLDRGHRRIAHLTRLTNGHDSQQHYSVADRCRGYVKTMREAGLEPRTEHFDEWNDAPKAYDYFRALLSTEDRPTALVCYGAGPYINSLIDAARDCGLSMPGDLALIGFDTEWQDFGKVQVAQCRNPHREVGRGAVEMLLHKIEHDNQPMPSQAPPFTIFAGNTLTPANSR